MDSTHVDADVAFDDLNSWYMVLGEHIRNRQFKSKEISDGLDEDVIEAMVEAANDYQERKSLFSKRQEEGEETRVSPCQHLRPRYLTVSKA